jgi:dUTP pyrophosphatase
MQLSVFRLTETARLPVRGSPRAVGYDLFADKPVVIPPSHRALVHTGIAMAIPDGFYGRIAPRSGLAFKNGIIVLAGVIDPDYRGEVMALLLNAGEQPLDVTMGARIAQLVIEQVATPEFVEVDRIEDLSMTARGEGGFGSTGVSG